MNMSLLFDEFPNRIAFVDGPFLINPILWSMFSIGILVPLKWFLSIIYFVIELFFVRSQYPCRLNHHVLSLLLAI